MYNSTLLYVERTPTNRLPYLRTKYVRTYRSPGCTVFSQSDGFWSGRYTHGLEGVPVPRAGVLTGTYRDRVFVCCDASTVRDHSQGPNIRRILGYGYGPYVHRCDASTLRDHSQVPSG